MSKPIEGCPQPEAEIRERAYTPEQLERHAKHCDAVEEHDAARMLRTFAATLRQQPTNPPEIGSKLVGDDVASDAAVLALDAYLWKEHGVCLGKTAMRAALEAVAPLLRAPGGQGVRVDEADIEAMRSASMEIKHNKEPWFPMTDRRLRRAAEALLARRAALAQNAQAEAVVEVYRMGNGLGSLVYTDYGAKSDLPHGTKLYLHAERARVPTDAMLAAFVHTWNGGSEWLPSPMNLTKRQLARARKAYDAFLAAAPSLPEDAA